MTRDVCVCVLDTYHIMSLFHSICLQCVLRDVYRKSPIKWLTYVCIRMLENSSNYCTIVSIERGKSNRYSYPSRIPVDELHITGSASGHPTTQ